MKLISCSAENIVSRGSIRPECGMHSEYNGRIVLLGTKYCTQYFDIKQSAVERLLYFFRFCIALCTACPMSAGLAATSMLAAARAATFSAAVPLPPLMIAPAWPIRRPGGAVRPAMKAATGLVTWALT